LPRWCVHFQTLLLQSGGCYSESYLARRTCLLQSGSLALSHTCRIPYSLFCP
jgi:hypothetical protein